MSKNSFGWLTGCIISCSIAVSTILCGKTAQAQTNLQVSFLNGVWIGSYTCEQGLTKLRLDIEARNSEDIDAIFSFSEHSNNPGTPSGSFTMKGNLDASGLLNLSATRWIDRPLNYLTVNLSGKVSSNQSISGEVLSPNCSTFKVVKAKPQNIPELESESSSLGLSQTNIKLQLDEQEQVVASFHQAIQEGNFDSLDRYYCSAEKIAAQELNRYADPEGQKKTLLDFYMSIATSIYSLNMSNLYYETKYYDPELERAVVAITGNVILESSNGQSAIPYRQFSTFGRDWLRLIKENGEWKLCHNYY